nr:hypothetical protein [Desulfobacula sp.]
MSRQEPWVAKRNKRSSFPSFDRYSLDFGSGFPAMSQNPTKIKPYPLVEGALSTEKISFSPSRLL